MFRFRLFWVRLNCGTRLIIMRVRQLIVSLIRIHLYRRGGRLIVLWTLCEGRVRPRWLCIRVLRRVTLKLCLLVTRDGLWWLCLRVRLCVVLRMCMSMVSTLYGLRNSGSHVNGRLMLLMVRLLLCWIV